MIYDSNSTFSRLNKRFQRLKTNVNNRLDCQIRTLHKRTNQFFPPWQTRFKFMLKLLLDYSDRVGFCLDSWVSILWPNGILFHIYFMYGFSYSLSAKTVLHFSFSINVNLNVQTLHFWLCELPRGYPCRCLPEKWFVRKPLNDCITSPR